MDKWHVQADSKLQNKMRDIRVAKLVLNICVGESGDRLQKAAKVGTAGLCCRPVHWSTETTAKTMQMSTSNSGRTTEGVGNSPLAAIVQCAHRFCHSAGARAADRTAACLWKGTLHSAHICHQEE